MSFLLTCQPHHYSKLFHTANIISLFHVDISTLLESVLFVHVSHKMRRFSILIIALVRKSFSIKLPNSA